MSDNGSLSKTFIVKTGVDDRSSLFFMLKQYKGILQF